MSSNENFYNILIISHRYWPDTSNPRAFRWSSIAEYFVEKGNVVDVVSLKKKGRKKREIKNGVTIYRANDIFQFFRNYLLGEKTVKEVDQLDGNSGNTKKNNLYLGVVKLLIFLRNNIWDNIYWPDKDWLWIFPAFFQARKLMKLKDYDVVITVARPFSSHVVGLLLYNKKKKRKWICDIGDPFSFDREQRPNNLFLYYKLNMVVERKIFLKSGIVTVTTDETTKEYCKALKLTNSIFKTIPPLLTLGIDQNEKNSSFKNKYFNLSENNISFFGSLYSNIRNPSYLLRLITSYNKTFSDEVLKLHFFGYTSDCIKLFEEYNDLIGKWILLHGKVERSEIPFLMAQSDLLVNIGNKTSYQLPSKIIEYISSGNSILNIASIKNDSSHQELKKYPQSLTIFEDEDINIAVNKLHEFILNFQHVDRRLISKLLERHSLDNIADEYFSLISMGKFPATCGE